MLNFSINFLNMISLLALSWLIRRIAAQTLSPLPQATFAYPIPLGNTPVLVINFIDVIVVEWTTNFEAAYLYLWCYDYDSSDGAGTYRWYNNSVPTNGNVSYSPTLHQRAGRTFSQPYICHFDLNWENQENQDKNINGPFFNLTSVANRGPTTYARLYTTTSLSASSSTITPTPKVGTSSSSVAATTSTTGNQTETNNNNNNKSGGLSTGAKAGIAIGAVVGVLALLGLGYVAWRNNRALKRLQASLSVVQPPAGYQENKYDSSSLPVVQPAAGYEQNRYNPPSLSTVQPATGYEENRYSSSRPHTMHELAGRT